MVQTAGKTVFWDQVSEGQELPPVSLDITIKRCAMLVAGTRDYYDGHHNREFAQAQGNKDMFLNTPFYQGFLGRALTDWSGPRGKLRKVGIAMLIPSCPGDTITVKGKVVKKYKDAQGNGLVDLEVPVYNPRGLAVRATATVQLPLPSGPR